eukprot:jgi/Psemu1/9095/gm1.9095_g
MSDDNNGTVRDRDRNDREGSDDESRNHATSVPFDGDSSNYRYSGYFPPRQPVYFPGSSFNSRRYLPVTYYYPPIYSIHDSHGDFPSMTTRPMAKKTPATTTPPIRNSQNWNLANPPSPLKRSTAGSSDTEIPETQAEGSDNAESVCELSTSPLLLSRTTASDEFIDPTILEAAKELNLPFDGHKYSVTHWKGALRLCYRWKTTTNEDEREFYRTSTTTNSLSSNNLKSVKSFCENILKRKSKRRQFAIHWKESGLKKLVDEASSTRDVTIGHSDPKLERILEDYFSGRTRSTGYHQAREKVLEDRQKEIVALWDALMSGPVLSDASSRQKLYLIQLAIEKPYHNKKVEIEAKDQKIVHDVTIEGYGGKSYWEQSNTSTKTESKSDTFHDPSSKTVDGVLPVNSKMMERFWKCVKDVDTRVRHRKRRRSSAPLVLSEDNTTKQVNESTYEEFARGSSSTESQKRCKRRDIIQCEEDKENERSSVVPV